MSTIVELRCPEAGKLLAKTVLSGEYRLEGQLIEVACRACRDELRYPNDWKKAPRYVELVLHRFDVEGNLVETEVR